MCRPTDKVENMQAPPVAGMPENSTHIYFRDVILPASDDSEGEDSEHSERESNNGETDSTRRMSRRRFDSCS